MDEQIKGLCSKARPDYLKYPQYSSPSDKKRSSSLVRFPKVPFDSLYIQTIQPRTSSNLIWGLGTSTYNKAYLATKRDYTSIALGRFCSFPSFSAINESVGYDGDFIGGYMTPVESQTQEALRRAASILKGTPANSFPQITESAKNYLFDYPTLNKWGMRLERTASKQHLLEHALCGSLSNIYYSMRDSSNPIYPMDAFLSKSTIPSRSLSQETGSRKFTERERIPLVGFRER